MDCRDPVRCNNCWRSGHMEKDCKEDKILRDDKGNRILCHTAPPPRQAAAARPLQSTPPQAPRPQAAAPLPRLHARAPANPMPRAGAATRAGAPESRPDEDSVVIEATPEMIQEGALLGSNCAVAWIDGMVEGVSTGRVQRAVAAACSAFPDNVCVVAHHPEQYFLTFTHPHHLVTALSRPSIVVDQYTLQVRPWRLEAHADNVDMSYHVRIGLENVPLHGWNLHTVARIIGKNASLDYIEGRSLRKESTDLLWCWAWTEDPSGIPKIKRVTLPARQAPGGRDRGRRGLRHRVLVHLATVEDFTSVDAYGNPPPPYNLSYKLGEVNGEATARRRGSSPQRQDERRGRRDDEDRDGRDGRHRSRSWGDALRRGLSRGPRREEREQGRDGRGAGDRRTSRDGRRHDAALGSPQDAEETRVLGTAVSADTLGSALAALAARRDEVTVGGSFNQADDDELGLSERRGRARARNQSPRATRELSRANQSPPNSPSSPVSVLPSSIASRKTTSILQGLDEVAQSFCSPNSMLRPLRIPTPNRPPGFVTPDAISPTAVTPIFSQAAGRARTSSSPPMHGAALVTLGLEQLFEPMASPLLRRPSVSPPPPRPTARRKTLAIHRSGRPLRFASDKSMAKKAKPVSLAAEAFVCRNLGIVQDGEDVTEQALDALASTFKNQATAESIRKLRIMFKLDSAQEQGIEEAMMNRGGASALEQFAPEETNLNNV